MPGKVGSVAMPLGGSFPEPSRDFLGELLGKTAMLFGGLAWRPCSREIFLQELKTL